MVCSCSARMLQLYIRSQLYSCMFVCLYSYSYACTQSHSCDILWLWEETAIHSAVHVQLLRSYIAIYRYRSESRNQLYSFAFPKPICTSLCDIAIVIYTHANGSSPLFSPLHGLFSVTCMHACMGCVATMHAWSYTKMHIAQHTAMPYLVSCSYSYTSYCRI